MSDAVALKLGASLIRHFEGCTLAPVCDVGTAYSIGWGMDFLPNGSAVDATTPAITQDTADAWLDAELYRRAQIVDGIVPVDATSFQRAAMYDFAWNFSPERLQTSTLLYLWRNGNLRGAIAQLGQWVHSGGAVNQWLVTRRAVEATLMDVRG